MDFVSFFLEYHVLFGFAFVVLFAVFLFWFMYDEDDEFDLLEAQATASFVASKIEEMDEA